MRLGVAENTETVWLIDWQHPEKNDFAIAEEVTLKGPLARRPDLVLYVNGIAIAVIELKNGRVSIGDGIRQLFSNQSAEFNAWFFSTVQLVFAGNDSEGLQYGTIGTEEKMFLRWKEDENDNADLKLDKYLQKMCRKERLLELIHDYVLFDGGKKKLPRVHQYFGIKAAQDHVRRREGGIIWHTQSGTRSGDRLRYRGEARLKLRLEGEEASKGIHPQGQLRNPSPAPRQPLALHFSMPAMRGDTGPGRRKIRLRSAGTVCLHRLPACPDSTAFPLETGLISSKDWREIPKSAAAAEGL